MNLKDAEQEKLLGSFYGSKCIFLLLPFPLWIHISEEGLSVTSALRKRSYRWKDFISAIAWHYHFGYRAAGEYFSIHFLLQNGKTLRLPGMEGVKMHQILENIRKYVPVEDQTGEKYREKNLRTYMKLHVITALSLVCLFLLLRYLVFPI